MGSAKGFLLSAIGRLVLREAIVDAVRELGERMRMIDLRGDALRDVAWTPGDKIQVLLPSKDVRTYTPASWNATTGAVTLITFDHGPWPGSTWTRNVRVGDVVKFVGPQKSVRRPSSFSIVVGDETSFGLAVALGATGVFEVGAMAQSDILTKLGVPHTAIVRRADDTHLQEIVRKVRMNPDGALVLTGRAQSIQVIRTALRHDDRSSSISKPYWSVGKTGLD